MVKATAGCSEVWEVSCIFTIRTELFGYLWELDFAVRTYFGLYRKLLHII